MPLLTEDMCFFAGPHKSSGYSSEYKYRNLVMVGQCESQSTATAHSTMGVVTETTNAIRRLRPYILRTVGLKPDVMLLATSLTTGAQET